MRSIVKVETKRILKTEMFLVFIAAVFLLSITSSRQAVRNYELWDEGSLFATGEENLRHGKEHAGSREIEEAIVKLREMEKAVFVGDTNIEKLVALNYSGRAAEDLSDQEISLFFEKRLEIIKQSLDESSHFSYTEGEKQRLMEEAGKLTGLITCYSEGWKVLNRDMGSFIPLMLVMISILIMPLFASDAQTKMNELIRSSMKGKRQLDTARVVTAYMTGSFLYLFAVLFYFVIKMIPFEFSGGEAYIQSSADTFFSIFHISYTRQFIWNCLRGYAALVFMISMTILVSVLMERILAGIAVICFYWGLLLIMNQMVSVEVNHLFANFMPLRLAGSNDFYVQNEIYRFAGMTFDSIIWCPIVTLVLSSVMLGIFFIIRNVKYT